jgi:hypothetical protein
MQRHVIIFVVLSVITGSVSASRADLIQNGGFEEGDFASNFGNVSPIPSWGGSQTFATDDSDFPHGGFGPLGGAAYAAFGAQGGLDSISQMITTNPGQGYFVDYWFASDGSLHNEFQVSWNNTVLFDQTDIPQHGYQEYSFLVQGFESNTLTFAGQDDLGYLSLDDVRVDAAPEPGSLTLLGLGLASFGGLAWLCRFTQKNRLPTDSHPWSN